MELRKGKIARICRNFHRICKIKLHANINLCKGLTQRAEILHSGQLFSGEYWRQILSKSAQWLPSSSYKKSAMTFRPTSIVYCSIFTCRSPAHHIPTVLTFNIARENLLIPQLIGRRGLDAHAFHERTKSERRNCMCILRGTGTRGAFKVSLVSSWTSLGHAFVSICTHLALALVHALKCHWRVLFTPGRCCCRFT